VNSCGWLLHFIDVSGSEVYRLTPDKLGQVCFTRGLDCSGPARALRQKLSGQIKSTKLQTPPGEVSNQTVVTTDVGDRADTPVLHPVGDALHGGSREEPVTLLVELLRHLSPLSSEEPEAIMNLFVRLDEIYELGLVEGRIFIIRILALLSGSVLVFVGNSLREGNNWAACKAHLLEKNFLYFVRGSLVRERIVICFHKKRQPLRQYIEIVYRTAKFLNYQATEEQLVDSVLMNLCLFISVNTAFFSQAEAS